MPCDNLDRVSEPYILDAFRQRVRSSRRRRRPPGIAPKDRSILHDNYERSDNSVTGERAGRWGSIVWTLAAQTPHIGTHSFVVLGLMALGIAALAAIMLHAFRENYFPAETLLLAFYLIGYSAQPLAVQRYVEPPILLTFATFAARLPKARRPNQAKNPWLNFYRGWAKFLLRCRFDASQRDQ
jgi:hypothetical protein